MSVEQYKSRLVVKGSTQKKGVNFIEISTCGKNDYRSYNSCDWFISPLTFLANVREKCLLAS